MEQSQISEFNKIFILLASIWINITANDLIANGNHGVLINLRSTQTKITDYSQELSRYDILQDKTKEFSNGNSFVMLNPDKNQDFSLAYQAVAIAAPEKLDANDAMELFLKWTPLSRPKIPLYK